jgi:hypothetical protein
MAKSIARNVVKEYLETSAGLSGKDLEKGASLVLVYLRLGMIKTDDVQFERNKISAIRKICVKDNSVLLATKKGSLPLPSNTRPNIVRMETPAEKLKRLLEPR